MEKYTKEERKETYLKAAAFFELPPYERKMNNTDCLLAAGFCDYLQEYELGSISDFPEYLSLKPIDSLIYWFSIVDQTIRINALKKAAEMCN